MPKNMLVREHGFSPAQLLFGKEPRNFREMVENGEACAYHFSVGDRGSQVARRMKMRFEAKEAFFHAQAKHMLEGTPDRRSMIFLEGDPPEKCDHSSVAWPGISGWDPGIKQSVVSVRG